MVLPQKTQLDSLRCFEQAMRKLDELIKTEDAGDANYFRNAQSRYAFSLQRILTLYPNPCTVLDIGSHYLHQSILLKTLGYDVYAIDVPLFAEAKLIRDRAARYSIKLFSISNLGDGAFMNGLEDSFQLVIFTEVLEHITFNPVCLWRRVYELLTEGGYIYLTTPNALRPGAVARALYRIFSFQGIGLPIIDILEGINFGHHWKEYSAWEIRRYFRQLSTDFNVKVRWFDDESCNVSPLRLTNLLRLLPAFRANIEAIICLQKKRNFCASPPTLPIAGYED
jgi:2-polyprenyl-6-hydroxyphenyl methylase/3-demethylubiquinone-9 3-methyltransferase